MEAMLGRLDSANKTQNIRIRFGNHKIEGDTKDKNM